eukprot:scaffold12546_cov110-Skeletonema_dohrnii-CCMP3373.AAC.2
MVMVMVDVDVDEDDGKLSGLKMRLNFIAAYLLHITFKCKRELSLMDWLILILLLQTRTPLITSTSWPSYGGCFGEKRVLGGRESCAVLARLLLIWYNAQDVSSVGATANPSPSAASNMVNPNSDHKLTFSHPYHYYHY